jgi:hypothetical protein
MKNNLLLLILLIVFTTACNSGGGGSSTETMPEPVTYSLKGTAVNLTGNVKLTDSQGNSISLSDNGVFDFSPAEYRNGNDYQVVVTDQPADQVCRVAFGTGTFTDSDISNVEVICGAPGSTPNICALPPAPMASEYAIKYHSVAYGSGLGASGFSTFDTDEDGYPEILFGSGKGFEPNTSFIVIEYDETSGTYKSLCQSKEYTSDIKKIMPFSNHTITAGTLIALKNGNIEVVNNSTGVSITTIQSGHSGINDMATGDIDNDGKQEIIILTDNAISIYNSNSFALEYTLDTLGGKSLALGHFTTTNALELAINNGMVIKLLGGSMLTTWDYHTLGFGDTFVSAGDIDNDGLDEIIAADSWYNIRAFNADTHGYLWDYRSSTNIDALAALDTDGDDIPEVIYSDAQHGSTYILNGQDASIITSYPNNHSGVTSLLVDDFDKDNNLELAWGVGYGTTGADYLNIADLSLNLPEWISPPDESDTYAIAFGDITGDTEPEILYATRESESGSSDGIVTAIDNTNYDVLWRTLPETFNSTTWSGINALTVADIDNNGENEVLVGASVFYDGYVFALDASNGQLVSSLPLPQSTPAFSLKLADINGDSSLEILAGAGSTYIDIIDASTFSWESTLPSLISSPKPLWTLDTVDWDNDQNLDIIALTEGAYIIEPEINALQRTTNQNYTAEAVFGNKVYLATEQGGLEQLNNDVSTTPISSICSDSILSLEAINADKLAFTCGGRLGVYQISTDTVSWQTDVLDLNLGLHDSLRHSYIQGISTLLVGGRTAYTFTHL